MSGATLALLMIATSGQSLAATNKAVEVNYKNPESFRDASLSTTGYERGADEFVMKDLRSYMEGLGERYLKPGQQLQIEVRDIDLAGRYEPWRTNASQVRFMRDITWPSINLHYVLKQNSQVLKQADAQLSDKFYLQRPGRATHSDRLYAEKAMLDDWFRTQFAHP
ncbi:DUF3016 domain-containing protein [Pseudomonas sp. LS1212]|uniref:DUF3016 domain-containing protein n=1 Tax=Pseudomonas sp. LS1212 TaxID=2972478 RepID=UPI0038CD728C